jgi:hypothetical protein
MLITITDKELAIIKELVEYNDHTSAYVLCAKIIQDEILENKFEKILREQVRVGYLPEHYTNERYVLYKTMMKIAESNMNKEDYQTLYMCF